MSAFSKFGESGLEFIARAKEDDPSAKKVFENKELGTPKSHVALTAVEEVPRLKLMLTAAGVSTCMLMALERRQFIDCILITLILVAYPPFVRKFRWLLLVALLSAEV
ncbi:hypothetical protein CLCR_11326 [Cladophialophora carrionii]|uniref:Uncharacterized protein n=1 Tax=Cladophialophora carrionii TaxID=86049 RepID=A0A1C1CLM7_9EURO|nr:hypothetical protein CLCR_11326 [Cladophialophora carrionii]